MWLFFYVLERGYKPVDFLSKVWESPFYHFLTGDQAVVASDGAAVKKNACSYDDQVTDLFEYLGRESVLLFNEKHANI